MDSSSFWLDGDSLNGAMPLVYSSIRQEEKIQDLLTPRVTPKDKEILEALKKEQEDKKVEAINKRREWQAKQHVSPIGLLSNRSPTTTVVSSMPSAPDTGGERHLQGRQACRGAPQACGAHQGLKFLIHLILLRPRPLTHPSVRFACLPPLPLLPRTANV